MTLIEDRSGGRGSVADERAARLARLPLAEAGPARGLVRGTWRTIAQIVAHHELLGLLVRRELRSRYKGSALGFLWSLLRPLALLIVYYVAIGKFLGAERSIPDFAIYLFSGLTAWTLFSEIVSGGTGSIVGNAGLIKKVYIPREVFPLAVVGSALFNFVTMLAVLVGATLLLRDLPDPSAAWLVPLAILVLLVWGLALGMALGAVNVYLRDVQYLVEIVLMVGFWASPIVYSWEYVQRAIGPMLQEIYLANPVTMAVLAFQRGMWVAGAEEPYPDLMVQRLLVMLGIGIVALWAAQRIFSRLEADFAQEL